jgi:hypothetical protein
MLTPFWQDFADRIQHLLISQFSIAAPVLIWILVTFRRADLAGMKPQFDVKQAVG